MKRRLPARLIAARSGFTILEMLVAMAITVLLLVLVFSIVSFGLRNVRQVDERLRLRSDAATALSMIASDLESLAVETRPFEVLESEMETNPLTSCRLMGLARVFDNPGAISTQSFGELRAFSYRVALMDPVTGVNDANSVYALYRKTLPIGTTTANVSAAMLANPGQGLLQNYWSSGTNAAPNVDDYLIGNVVGFDIAWTYETLGPNSVPVRQTVPTGSDLRYRQGKVTIDGQMPPIPANLVKATITLTLLPDSDVKHLNGVQPTAGYITTNGSVFTREVHFGVP